MATVAFPTKAEIQAELRKLLPPWLLDDELVDAILWGFAASYDTALERAQERLDRLLLSTTSSSWLDLLAREHGSGRLYAEGDASLQLRGRIRARGVTRYGILEAIGEILEDGQGAWLVEPDAGPGGDFPRASFLDRTVYLGKPTHVLADPLEAWHYFALYVEAPEIVLRSKAFLGRGTYLERADYTSPIGPGFLDTNITGWANGPDWDENVVRSIWRATDLSRAAGVRFTLFVV